MMSLFAICFFFTWQSVAAESWKQLLDRADSLSNSQNLDSAIVIGKLALEKAEAEFGPEDTSVALVLHRLGNYNLSRPDYPEAQKYYERELQMREELFGEKDSLVATTLNTLAIALKKQGHYADAEVLYQRALAIREKLFGTEDRLVAQVLNNLANLYEIQGKYSDAESLFLRALTIREKVYGPDHARVAQILNNLAIVYDVQGRYAEAEPLYQRAIAIDRAVLGSENRDVARALSNLAVLYKNQGKYSEAESLEMKALAIREKLLGENDPDVALSLISLANIYMRQKKWAEAETRYKRALFIWENSTRAKTDDMAICMNNLANCYSNQQKYAEAEPLYIKALHIWQEIFGPGHPGLALTMHNQAMMYLQQQRYAQADSLFLQALQIRETVLGQNHYGVATILESYCESLRWQKRINEAMASGLRATRIRHTNFSTNAKVLSEKDALSYSQFLRNSMDFFLSCFVDLRPDDAQTVSTAADIILSGKGQVSDGIFERRKALVSETDSTTLALAESLRLTKFQLSQLFVSGPGEDVEAYRQERDSLNKLANELEAGLSRHSASFRNYQDYQNITCDRIASLLPDNSVLVEYLMYNYLQLKPDTLIPHYLVLVVKRRGEPVVEDLGEASKIDTLIKQYRTHMMHFSEVLREPTVVDQEDYRKITGQLYGKIWQKIEKLVAGEKLVFIAPDGALNMISFAGLRDKIGKYFVQRFAIHYLSSGRDLIRLQDKPEPGHGLFALGDPDFGASASVRLMGTLASIDSSAKPVYCATRNIRSGCRSLKEMLIDSLPGTRKEVEKIASQWRASTQEPLFVHFGPDASEENFKTEAPGNRVIHLATHGYFIEGACQPNLPKRGSDAEQGFVGENPLLLSGLLFAGANLHGEGADSLGAEDGILTAYEVSAMDLEGTDLVVLSACETGLGEIKEGEGVYGLRRAFQMAGARTVISALWPVSDQATADMMGQLYDKGNESLPQRIRNIQLKKIAELRADNKVDHPFSWGAFVALGDWR
jgi:CHAT domain-containing protein/Tfp pilus assembly protein PilF